MRTAAAALSERTSARRRLRLGDGLDFGEQPHADCARGAKPLIVFGNRAQPGRERRLVRDSCLPSSYAIFRDIPLQRVSRQALSSAAPSRDAAATARCRRGTARSSRRPRNSSPATHTARRLPDTAPAVTRWPRARPGSFPRATGCRARWASRSAKAPSDTSSSSSSNVATLAAAQPLQDEVPRDPEQVIANAALSRVIPTCPERRRRAQHREKRLLDDVVGGIAAAHVGRVAEDRALEAGKQPGEGDRIAAARQCDQPGTPRLRSG